MTGVVHTPPARKPRSTWKAVAIPAEHGGWGLTLEAVLLGLLVRPSAAGWAIGIGAFLAFLARTPLKIAVGDRRRGNRLERSVLAERLAAVELVAMVAAVVAAALTGQRWWWIPLAAAVPFFSLELWFDIRGRGRRLTPELSGAVGMGAVATALSLAGGLDARLAIGLWVVLASRALAAVPFARSQVRRLKRQSDRRAIADGFQLLALVVSLVGWAVGAVRWPALLAVVALAGWDLVALRRPVRSAIEVGVLQMVAGLAVVGITAAAVLTVT